MDWTTLRQLIYRQLHQDSSTVPTAVKDDVGIAICEAIRFNRRGQYYFNTARGVISTKIDQYDYKLPSDFFSMIGPAYFTPAGSSAPEARYPLMEGTIDEIEESKLAGNDYQTYPHSGRPNKYAIDTNEMRMLLAPTPSENDNLIDFRYQQDVGTPRYRYSGSAWAFYENDNETAISDTSTYTNVWFQEALDLTMWRALYHLWSSTYGGTEESSMKATNALSSWLECRNRLIAETNKRLSKRVVRKYI